MSTGTCAPEQRESAANFSEIASQSALKGMFLFPLRPGMKTPATTHGQDDASNDPAVLEAWAAAFPTSNVGVHCAPSGLYVIDVDSGEGKSGGASWDALVALHGHTDTLTVRTQSGGTHYYYRMPEGAELKNTAGKLGKHVDTRGNGYVVAPGSQVNGRPYTLLLDAPVAELPEWIAEAVRAKKPTTAVVAAAPSSQLFAQASQVSTWTTPADALDVRARVLQLAGELAAAPDGEGNSTAARLSFMVGGYVGAGQISGQEAQAELESALTDWTFTSEQSQRAMLSTIARGIEDGARTPRPWTASSAPVSQEAFQFAPPRATAVDHLAMLEAALLTPDELEARPRPVALVKGLLFADSLAWIIGEPGSFKSFVALDIASHIGAGLPWQGKETKRGGVLYLAAEGAAGMAKRLKAWRGKYGETPDVLTLPMAVQAGGPVWGALVELVAKRQPVLIVVDTQARVTVGMEENAAKDMGVFVSRLDELRQATGACVLTVHHTGRNGGDARGSSAIDGAQDTELKVTRPTGSKRKDLTATIRVEKQKDGEDGQEWAVGLERVVTGVDEDGEVLDTLVLSPHNAFLEASRLTEQDERPDWDANLSGNQAEFMATLRKVGDSERGATQVELLIAINEARKVKAEAAGIASKPMHKTSYYTARDVLAKADLIVVEKSRFYLPEYAPDRD